MRCNALASLILVLLSVVAFGEGPKYKKPDVAVPQNW